MRFRMLLVIMFTSVLSACMEEPEHPITIAINPWPGYEFLYLAEEKQFFKKVGANVRLLQLDSLSDAQRAYLRGHADGLASTLIEAVQAQALGSRPLSIVMVPDYSNGGDVIIANKPISSIADLKGKTIGCEVSSLGIYFLQRALAKHQLSIEDVNVINVEQRNGEQQLLNGKIDAFVSYPPVSVNILKNAGTHKIFSSADIPMQIIDVVAMADDVLQAHPKLSEQLLLAWDMALAYYQDNPLEAAAIMAKRESISAEEFQTIINEELMIMNSDLQREMLSPPEQLQKSLKEVCKTLVAVDSIQTDCKKLPGIYAG